MYPAVIQDQRYVFVDTPGFNDPAPTRTDLDIFLEILVWFRAMSPYCDLAGILYVHDIQTARNSASTETNLNMLKELCGEEFFPNVTILTTKWSRLAPGVIYQSENTQREFEEGPWRQLIAKGAQVFQHRCGVIEPTKNEILTEQRICDLQQQRKKAKGELERMICYYQYTKSITPKIQRELREGIGILMTGAGMVLQRSAGWPPTPDQVDNEAPRPADYGGDTSSRQPSSMIHVVHHHIETLTATTQPPTQSSGMTPQVLDDVTDSPPPMTWWSSLVLAVRWFILRRLIPSGSNSYFQLRVPQF
jgi:hypothetical protein